MRRSKPGVDPETLTFAELSATVGQKLGDQRSISLARTAPEDQPGQISFNQLADLNPPLC
jgi:hypothetical protein